MASAVITPVVLNKFSFIDDTGRRLNMGFFYAKLSATATYAAGFGGDYINFTAHYRQILDFKVSLLQGNPGTPGAAQASAVGFNLSFGLSQIMPGSDLSTALPSGVACAIYVEAGAHSHPIYLPAQGADGATARVQAVTATIGVPAAQTIVTVPVSATATPSAGGIVPTVAANNVEMLTGDLSAVYARFLIWAI